MTTQHSKLPPSSAARRMACPGSRAMAERYAHEEENEASKEGTIAHEVAAHYLQQGQREFVGTNPGITPEMLEGAQYYLETVSRFIDPNQIHVEEKISCTSIHPAMWGTPDAWGIDSDWNLHVFDFKYGFTPVDAFENWQLLAYACGIVDVYAFTTPIKNIYLHIVQPRDYVSSSKHKTWVLSKDELMTYRQRLVVSEAESMSPHATLRVSDQCKYCPARYACPALQAAAFGAAEVSFRDTPQGLSPRAVGAELKLLHEARDLLEYRITALETQAQHLLQAGEHVDHFELATVEGRLNWSTNKEKVIELGLLEGIDLRKEDIITPTQAIKAGLSQDAILKYTERKQSLKLSKIDVNKAKAVFKKH